MTAQNAPKTALIQPQVGPRHVEMSKDSPKIAKDGLKTAWAGPETAQEQPRDGLRRALQSLIKDL